MKLLKANPASAAVGAEELPGKANYFIGNPRNWRAGVRMFSKVRYQKVYPSIDLVYYGNQRQIEYDFVVAPGGNPGRIHIGISGARKTSVDEHGDLVLAMDAQGGIRWHKPVAYQEENGLRREIAASYILEKQNRIGFEIGNYDVKKPLFIDPLIYSTYLGGSGDDEAYAIAVDSSGSAYITGRTNSPDFPTINPLQSLKGTSDAFVAKFDPTGSALVYATYLGGSGDESGSGIAVDGSGAVYVTGGTTSTDFPTMNAFQPSSAGEGDAFVTKLDPTGSVLVYSTYLGGSGSDGGSAIAVDASGSAYVVGGTDSTDFPILNAYQTECSCASDWLPTGDGFVTKLSPTGSALAYSTYFGGPSAIAPAIAVDTSGNAYVAGSINFEYSEYSWAAKLDPTGSALVYFVQLGGSGNQPSGIAVDDAGNAYVVGSTDADDFPTVNPMQSYGGGGDAFVAKLNPAGSLVYSTFIGGSGGDSATAIAIDSLGNAYIVGYTNSTDFPTVNAFQPASAGLFVAKLNAAGSAFVYSSNFGGSGNSQSSTVIASIATDNIGNVYVTGSTNAVDFPMKGAFQGTNAGGSDAFVVKIGSGLGLTPTNLDLGQETVGMPSAPLVSVLTNTGNTALNIESISLVGINSGDFSQVNNCGSTLIANGSCNITVTFTPSATGARSAFLSLNNGDLTLALTGAGILPAVSFSPASLSFGNQTLNTVGPPQNVTLTNIGPGILKIANIAASGAFRQTNTCGGSVNPGANCIISVTFAPNVAGALSGAVSITDNAQGNLQALSLTGVGVLPAVTLSPAKVVFPNQTVSTTSSNQNATLTNTGLGVLTISSISVSGPFSQTNTCVAPLNPGAACIISITFSPNVTGTLTGAISIADNAPGNLQSLPLSGAGVLPAVTISPAKVVFPNQGVFTTSSTQNATLTNTGLGVLRVSSISVSGPFSQTNSCGAPLNPGATCIINIAFSPTVAGTLTGAVSITDNAPGSPQSLPLTGVGVLPTVTFSPAKVVFPNQTVFTTSPVENATLTNAGPGVLTIHGITASGPFSQTNTCSAPLKPGAACTISIKFAPKSKGTLTGSVSVTGNASGGPQTLLLTGTGTFMQFSPTSLSFGNQPLRTQSLAKKLTLTNKGGASVSITGITVTGANAGDFTQTNTCGKTIASGASCFITVKFKPLAKGKRTANVSVNDTGGGSPQTAVVSGSGT
jgi:hypothetical protein